MTEIVYLRLVRKRRARVARERNAAENRTRFGRSRAAKERDEALCAIEEARLSAHRLKGEDNER